VQLATCLSVPLWGKTPSRLLHLAERNRALEQALAALSLEEREWLELRFVEGLRPSEIVRVLALELEPNTLSQRIVRIVRRLRARLQGRSELESFRR